VAIGLTSSDESTPKIPLKKEEPVEAQTRGKSKDRNSKSKKRDDKSKSQKREAAA
jgi:hypothetical protein